MYLTKVELNGFKSFADKVSFEFDKGITAILGPNGCGKSNVVDAVKWVLGETSAKNLRGKEMTDVIFAGSEKRKALGMAEVSLFFNNEDGKLPVEYNEVCVTRRLFRSGESEYLINKQQCRKRDITDLFLDTGIGRSAYSFIEQGKVEALLQAKPAERRQVFEEAAGISKYKQRRKETLARLDRTNQYLFRVTDIVDEVDKNVRKVSRQASSARRFQRLTEELNNIKSIHYVRSFRNLTEELKQATSEHTEIQQLLTAETASQATLASQIAELTQQEITLTEKVNSHEKSALEIQESLGKCQSELSAANERIQSLTRQSEEAKDRAEIIRKRLAEMNEEEVLLKASIEESSKTADAHNLKLEEQGAERNALQETFSESEKQLIQTRNEIENLRRERSELESAKVRAESEDASLRQRLVEITSRKQQVEDERQNYAANIESLTISRNTITAELDAVTSQVATLREEQQTRMNEREQLAEELSNLKSRQSSIASRKSTLEDLEKNMAGTHAGVKAALQGKRDNNPELSEIEGMAAELINAPTDVALAIETTLGGNMQDIIVRSATGGQRAIEYLKRERKGRATFLPLDSIRSRKRIANDYRGVAGIIGEAVDLVTFDEQYRSAMEYLLAGVLIVDNLQSARELSRSQARGVRLVTLEGEVINPHGAMTGGHRQNSGGGLVTRKAEMEELTKMLGEIETTIEQASQKRTFAETAAMEAGKSASELSQKREALSADKQKAELNFEAANENIQKLSTELENVGTGVNDINMKLEAIQIQVAGCIEKTQNFGEHDNELHQTLTTLAQSQAEARTKLDSLNETFSALREQRAEVQSKLEEEKRRMQIIERDRSERDEELKKCTSFTENTAAEMVSLKERHAELLKSEEEMLNQRDGSRESGVALRQQQSSLRQRLDELRSQERACQSKINQVNEAINNLKLKESETNIKLEQIVERAREELKITDLSERAEQLPHTTTEEIHTVVPEGAEVTPLTQDDNQVPYMSDEQITENIEEISGKISRIGPVNMYAIDELAELEARGEFLKAEQEDIESAVNDLMSVIERLNDECHKRFEETFVAVRENFQEMFKTLFGGGKADLVLEKVEEGMDKLDAGIDIIARPPGKEPKNISLLSGGEKALCAVALLFALFRTKPSPFCILDEVDGPLDESNIDRFMNAVNDFTDETQFILISHAKRTMGMTDTIYGVTQDEPGVSTKYSLRFEDAYDRKVNEPKDEEVAVTA